MEFPPLKFSMLPGKSVAIVGAGGFIGSHLVNALLNHNCNVPYIQICSWPYTAY